MTGTPKLLILDVDGTIRWTVVPGRKYPLGPHEWRLMPHVRETLGGLGIADGSLPLGVASNQEGVSLGLIGAREARDLIVDALVSALGRLPETTAIEMCTCPLDQVCPCRKPAPGMLLRLLERFSVQPRDALFVGDQEIDREAAARAGVAFRSAQEFFVPRGSPSLGS